MKKCKKTRIPNSQLLNFELEALNSERSHLEEAKNCSGVFRGTRYLGHREMVAGEISCGHRDGDGKPWTEKGTDRRSGKSLQNRGEESVSAGPPEGIRGGVHLARPES